MFFLTLVGTLIFIHLVQYCPHLGLHRMNCKLFIDANHHQQLPTNLEAWKTVQMVFNKDKTQQTKMILEKVSKATF